MREGGLVGVLDAVDDGHLLCVAAGVVGELVEAAADGLDVAGEGGEAGGAGGGEEAGGDEAVELGLDVGDGGLEDGAAERGEAHACVVGAAEDLFCPGDDVVGRGVQPGPDVLDDAVERFGVPGGAACLGDERRRRRR